VIFIHRDLNPGPGLRPGRPGRRGSNQRPESCELKGTNAVALNRFGDGIENCRFLKGDKINASSIRPRFLFGAGQPKYRKRVFVPNVIQVVQYLPFEQMTPERLCLRHR
jgi:hypothetical protein